MWPLTSDAHPLWLGLYLLTFAMHVVLIGYVLAGTGYALVQSLRSSDDPVAADVRDRLPFMLGLGITAGVAPLLFLQLLYQRRFYSANLILGPRWGAVVPALVLGFYALYLAKATGVLRRRRLALGVGLACFAFVAWSWTEIHLLMQDEPAWKVMYGAADRLYAQSGVLPRLALWLGAMLTTFAVIAAWFAAPAHRPRLAVLGLVGRLASLTAAVILWHSGAAIVTVAHGWLYILGGALVVEAAGWLWMWRAGSDRALSLVTGAATCALVAGTIVREAPRLLLLEPPRVAALDAQGMWVFVLTALFGIAAIAWIVRTIRRV